MRRSRDGGTKSKLRPLALLCCEALGLPGAEFSRGYMQASLKAGGQGQAISERSAQRICHAADQILRAGRPQPSPP
jgi:hypothetical protein